MSRATNKSISKSATSLGDVAFSQAIKLSVLVPVYNEEKTIIKILERLLAVKEVAEIVVVDDGSTDNSKLLIEQFLAGKVDGVAEKIVSHETVEFGKTEEFGKKAEAGNEVETGKKAELRNEIMTGKKSQVSKQFKVSKKSKAEEQSATTKPSNLQKIKFFTKKNGGKGSAIRLALSKATGNYVMIQDADLEYDPADIPAMLAPIQSGKASVIYGSRFLGPHSNLLFWHRVGNFMLNFLVNILYNTTLSDMETCYKLMPTKLARELNLQADSFELEPEITCKILKRGIHIFEVPISYVGRDFSEGKKITWRDGFTAVWVVVRERVVVEKE